MEHTRVLGTILGYQGYVSAGPGWVAQLVEHYPDTKVACSVSGQGT